MDTHMTLPYEVFAIGYAATILTGSIAAMVYFVGLENMKKSIIALNFRRNWIFVIILIVLPMILFAESRLSPLVDSESLALKNNSWMMAHGGELIRYIQHRLEVGLITDIFILIYVWIFTFIIYFTPLYLLFKNDSPLFRKFSFAMILNYIILLPFYTFLPVSVTSYSPPTMLKPLLYIDTSWGRLVTAMDPLDNDFPSGHISLLLSTLLILSSSYQHRKYTHFVLWGLISMTFAVLYLGIHWIMDIIGGIFLGVGIVLLVENTRLFERRIEMTADVSPDEEMKISDGEDANEISPGRTRVSYMDRLGSIFRKNR